MWLIWATKQDVYHIFISFAFLRLSQLWKIKNRRFILRIVANFWFPNNNFKEDIFLVESCRFSCRLIQQKGMEKRNYSNSNCIKKQLGSTVKRIQLNAMYYLSRSRSRKYVKEIPFIGRSIFIRLNKISKPAYLALPF